MLKIGSLPVQFIVTSPHLRVKTTSPYSAYIWLNQPNTRAKIRIGSGTYPTSAALLWRVVVESYYGEARDITIAIRDIIKDCKTKVAG